MNGNTSQKAISAALSGNWEEAIKINKQILQQDPKDADALNRLARAYAEQGNFKKAKMCATKVLDIDPLNTIAQKCLTKWSQLENQKGKSSNCVSSATFLEEPGKTKIVTLMHLGDRKTIASLDSGDEIVLDTNKRKVSINTVDGDYIGRLTDDLSQRLRELKSHGNEYQAFIKSVGTEKKECVTIFIREVKRSKKLSHIPSFTSEKVEFVSLSKIS
jgi:tetratricopeptide (TPR) repeat protein